MKIRKSLLMLYRQTTNATAICSCVISSFVCIIAVSCSRGGDSNTHPLPINDNQSSEGVGPKNPLATALPSYHNPHDVARFIGLVKKSLRDDDAQLFTRLVQLPIVIYPQGRPLIVERAEDLITEFPNLFPNDRRAAILETPISSVFTNGDGVIFFAACFEINGGGTGSTGYVITEMTSGMTGNSLSEPYQFYRPDGRVTISRLTGSNLASCIKALNLPYVLRLDLGLGVCTERGDDYMKYKIYRADINNDGGEDIIVTNVNRGSGNFSDIDAIYHRHQGQWIRTDQDNHFDGKWPELDYLRIYRDSLIPKAKLPIEFNDFQSRLARPFLYRKYGKIYHGFDDWEFYL